MTSPTNTQKPSAFRKIATKESALFVVFLFFGLVLLPMLVYYVGQAVFGEYSGLGFGDFYGTLNAKIRSGDWAAWFLVISPYLGWQCLRLMFAAWKFAGRDKTAQ